ncbi:hypothetical protein A5886_001801 [Enterococcus sp. 8G7_MSG3316]|uniref:Bacteriophage Gp15 protein n=1 Tax=Candidatus Enterococcus testudinis TaxID=1834191 RepID=A0A242A6Z1_9ENTE|nr:Gp15 family bacteriophage protein [Enterococcus sp. 8G7_MSG3316]OTN76722.1 hypothetical protein A5886_001801 [Enterococcus sp. 8G7_MSG3316]
MRLNDSVVTSFCFDEKDYPINLAFDYVLDALEVLNNGVQTEFEKACTCLDILVGEGVFEEENAIELWNLIYENFIHEEEKPFVEYSIYGEPLKIREEQKVLDIEIDADLIFSSFMYAYQINLFDQQGILPWSSFKALLHNLPADTALKRVIKIRMWEPSDGDSAEYKEEMKNLQMYYALDEEGSDG